MIPLSVFDAWTMHHTNQEVKQKLTIHAISLDGDDCLFNHGYYSDYENDPGRSEDQHQALLIKHNKSLVQHIRNKITALKPQQTKLMVGSARQSYVMDMQNSIRNGTISIYRALIYLSRELELGLDPYLLADTYGNRQSGYHFNEALERISQNISGYDCHDWIFDESKFSIVYAQIHKAATDHPNAQIAFDFYDDRENILEELKIFFAKNLTLLPRSVTLNFYHYEGEEVAPFGELKGAGLQDSNFQQTILYFTEHLGIDHRDEKSYEAKYNFIQAFAKDRLLLRAFDSIRNFNTKLNYYTHPQQVTRRVSNAANPRQAHYEKAVAAFERLLSRDLCLLIGNESALKTEAGKLAVELEMLKFVMSSRSLTLETKQMAIRKFENRSTAITAMPIYVKAILLVAATAFGAVIGGLLGSIVPVTGTMVGAATGGTIAAGLAGFLLFKPSAVDSKITEVIEKASMLRVVARG